jgi:hypothetical protein
MTETRTEIDRRATGETPAPERRRAVVDRRSGMDRRRGPGRRRAEVRKAAEEGEISGELLDFIMAIDRVQEASTTAPSPAGRRSSRSSTTWAIARWPSRAAHINRACGEEASLARPTPRSIDCGATASTAETVERARRACITHRPHVRRRSLPAETACGCVQQVVVQRSRRSLSQPRRPRTAGPPARARPRSHLTSAGPRHGQAIVPIAAASCRRRVGIHEQPVHTLLEHLRHRAHARRHRSGSPPANASSTAMGRPSWWLGCT